MQDFRSFIVKNNFARAKNRFDVHKAAPNRRILAKNKIATKAKDIENLIRCLVARLYCTIVLFRKCFVQWYRQMQG